MAPADSVRVRPNPPAYWLVSGLLATAIAFALWGLTPVLGGFAWFFQAVLAVVLVLLAGAAVRSFSRQRFWGTVAAAGMAIAVLTMMFGEFTGILGFIPTFDTIGVFGELDRAGNRDILEQAIPATATDGIRFLVCLGVMVVAVVADGVTFILRAPALAGLPILVLLLVPSFVRAEFADPFLFAFTAAVWLAAMVAFSRPAAIRTAAGVGATAVVSSLVLTFVLPAVEPPAPGVGPGGDFATGLNPIITLGEDLRRGNPTHALTYRTSDDTEQYLRLTVLDDFTGTSWQPTSLPEPGNSVDEIGPVPGLGGGVPAPTVTTIVVVGNVSSRWLPVPYAASQIRGLEGAWSWESAGLTVRTERSNARGQGYEVDSTQPAPSVEQLVGAGIGPVAGMDRYLELPVELPATVAQVAGEATAGAASNYDRALALQDFFRGGDFTYSEDAPVDEGYDGSGAEVLGAFLEERSGYCVHFSSAMAAMARTLGIPSRVVVGFAPGSAVQEGEDDEFTVFRVSTHNLHAWPELYFANIGWVRFEPTPGRGTPPAFAPLDEDDPSTPDVDESVPPPTTPAPSSTSTPTEGPDLPDEEETAAPDDAASSDAPAAATPWAALITAAVLGLLLTPAVARLLRRGRRLAAAGRGAAVDGWDELRDTAYDLGLAHDDSLTPRQLADELAPVLDDESRAALARVRSTVESHAFGRSAPAPRSEDIRAVLRGLRRGAGPGRTIVATFVPRSLARDWIPSLVERG